MKLPTRAQLLPAWLRALALSLALGTANAATLASQAPGHQPAGPLPAHAAASRTPAGPGQSALTPAAPVTSPVPSLAAEDIRDIRQPKHRPSSWRWAAAAAGVLALAAAALALWSWRRRRQAALLPHQVALQQLDQARRFMDPDHAREYCFAVSEIIRRYLEQRFRLHAPRLTTEEFLRELTEVRETILAPQRTLLGEFLQHCDLAKFAGWRYAQANLQSMHASARHFVQQSASEPAKTAGQPSQATPLLPRAATAEATPGREPALAQAA